MAENMPPTPINFDQSFANGAQREWLDSEISPPHQPPGPGYNPGANPPPGPPPPQQSYMPPQGVMPPVDSFQSAPPIPPPMPFPQQSRYINPRQPPTWNATYSMGSGPEAASYASERFVEIVSDSSPISPLLTLLAGGVIGYAFGGWKGGIGSALVMVGANNLGLAGEKTAIRLGVATLGLGIGGYMVHSSVKKTSLVPNPPKWLRRI